MTLLLRFFSFVFLIGLHLGLTAQDQSLTQIEGTDLHLELPAGYALVPGLPSISNDVISITFMQAGMLSYYDNLSDFDNIEADYAEKGIVVKDWREGKLGQYDAFIIELEVEPQMSQVFFGDDTFSAFVQIISTPGESYAVDEVMKELSSISYRVSESDPLEEHAQFELPDELLDEWTFQGLNLNNFMFEHEATGDVALLLQLPGDTWFGTTPELITRQFIEKYKGQGFTLTTLLEGKTEIAGTSAYQWLAQLFKDEDTVNSFLHIAAFGNAKGAFVFNGIGEVDTPERRARFDAFLAQISIRE